jgi:hypothetical protein
MKIHRHRGNGFQEVIYQRCLEIEMKLELNFNFGATSLQFRLLQNKYKSPHQRPSTNQ